MKKYKIVDESLIKNIIEFLDEVQFDAASREHDKEALHKINFCSWVINELLDSHTGFFKDEQPISKKEKDEIIEDHFVDWTIPEDMTTEEFEKMVDQFDAFLRGWEKEYTKGKSKKKSNKKESKFNKPHVEDVAEYMSLDEIKEYLIADEELNDHERFELYYDEHCRVQKEKAKKKGLSYDELLKGTGIKNPKKNKKKLD